MPDNHKADRLVYADSIRTVAILLVVVSHIGALIVYRQPLTTANAQSWALANFLMTIGRPCVPLFVMLSGALLLNPQKPDESIGTFLRKRLSKVVIPGLIWSVIFLAWRKWGIKEPIELSTALQALQNGTVFGHLWFLYMILGLYIAAPVLRPYIRSAKLSNQGYFLTVWFLITSLAPFLKKFLNVDFYGFVYVPLQGYVGLFIGGYFLSQVPIGPKLRRSIPWFVVACGMTLTILSYQSAPSVGQKFDDYFHNYLTPFSVLISAGLFLILRDLPYASLLKKIPVLQSSIQTISALSFSLYLFHPIVLDLLCWITPPLTSPSVLVNAVVMTGLLIGTTLISLVTIALGRKIPGTAYLFP
jgi:surface polysaccharide O-acyltransferase-like enzyme